jgi:hypothetical protein
MQEGYLSDGEVCLFHDSLLEYAKDHNHIQGIYDRPLHIVEVSR